MPVEEPPQLFPLEIPESLIDAAHDLKALDVLPTLDDKLERIHDTFSRNNQPCPLILKDDFLSKGDLAKTLAPCVKAFVEGERKFNKLSTKYPHLSPYFLDKLHDIMGGQTCFSLCALSETCSKDIADLTELVSGSLNVQSTSVEKVTSALKFTMDLVRINEAPSRTIHLFP